MARQLTLLVVLMFCLAVYPLLPAEPGETIYVADMAGRTVEVPADITRVVPLGGAMRFIVYMDSFDMVAGVEALEHENPAPAPRVYSLAIEKKAGKIPAIGQGGPGRLPDFEKIIAVRPDIILAAGLDIQTINRIERATNVPVVVVNYGSTGSVDVEGTLDSINFLGRLLDRGKRAGEIRDFITSMVEDLDRRTKAPANRPSVYIGGIGFKGPQGINSTIPLYPPLAWINGVNAAADTGRGGHFFVDMEQILLWNPDVLFLDAGNIGIISEDYRKNPVFYRTLDAVQKGRVFTLLPYNFYHTNLETAIANAYFMGKVLYPGSFQEINPAEKADEIFSFFTGVEAYSRIKEDFHGYGEVSFGKSGVKISRH